MRRPETSALLTALAALIDDELAARRIAHELAERPHKPPRWLRRLTPLRFERAIEMGHILGDGDNLLLDVVTGTDHHVTVAAYIDHNLGTLVKDAFVVPEPLASLHDRFIELTEDDRDALVAQFLDSRFLEVDDIEAAEDLAHVFVWFAADYGPGDPLRWSQVSVEILLTSFLHRKVVLPSETMRLGPEVLRSFVRFAHAERSIDGQLTQDTLAALDREARTYLQLIDTAERDPESDIQDLVRMLSGERPEEAGGVLLDEDGKPLSPGSLRRQPLVRAVGGEQALESLTTEPLSDEPLDLSHVPEDIRERVARIAARVDACCDELFDVEHRTACRRLLSDVAAGDATIFRRRSRDDTAGATIAWLVGRANDSVGSQHSDLTARALLGWFGVSGSVWQRAAPMLRAIGAPEGSSHAIHLGTPRYLVSTKRERIAKLREQWR